MGQLPRHEAAHAAACRPRCIAIGLTTTVSITRSPPLVPAEGLSFLRAPTSAALVTFVSMASHNVVPDIESQANSVTEPQPPTAPNLPTAAILNSQEPTPVAQPQATNPNGNASAHQNAGSSQIQRGMLTCASHRL